MHGALAGIRGAAEHNQFDLVWRNDPAFAHVQRTPEFQALRREVIEGLLATAEARGTQTQPILHGVAAGYALLGDWDEAVATLERAIDMGGPLTQTMSVDLANAREQRDRFRKGR